MTRRDGFPLALQVLLWAASNTAAGIATGLAVGAFREGGFEPTLLWISILFGNVVGFTVLIASVVLFPRLRGLPAAARVALLGLALLSGSIAGTALVLYFFPLFVLRDVRQTLAIGAINGMLALVVGGMVHAYESLRLRLQETLREVEEVRLVEARLKEAAARAELSALQARINPHFFFNTLNTISSLLQEDPDQADDVVQSLAHLFRYTLRVADAGPVPLEDELEFVEGYLEIERARFGERLRVVWDVEDEARAARLPGLVLQPLVENAVGHGIAPLGSGGTVTIRAGVRDGTLTIEVADDGAGLDGAGGVPFREGHGLANVSQRLAAVYGGRALLAVGPGPGGRGATARVELPCSPDSAAGPRASGAGREARAR
jgi:signal transduction histidine kinase